MNTENNQISLDHPINNLNQPININDNADTQAGQDLYQEPQDGIVTNNATNEVDDNIRALEGGPQKTPGSSGAFPVGAFDISKD